MLEYNVKDYKDITTFEMFQKDSKWLPNVLQKDIQEEWFNSLEYYPKYYNIFKNIITLEGLKDVKFFEFGVRTGYIGNVLSKVSNDLNIRISYTGIDINQYESNGLDLAKETFELLELSNILKCVNSKTFNFSRFQNYYDIIHIDGDHSYDAKISDFINAYTICKNGGYILIDDYDHHEEVKRAVDYCLENFKGSYWYYKTLRGLIIFKVEKA